MKEEKPSNPLGDLVKKTRKAVGEERIRHLEEIADHGRVLVEHGSKVGAARIVSAGAAALRFVREQLEKAQPVMDELKKQAEAAISESKTKDQRFGLSPLEAIQRASARPIMEKRFRRLWGLVNNNFYTDGAALALNIGPEAYRKAVAGDIHALCLAALGRPDDAPVQALAGYYLWVDLKDKDIIQQVDKHADAVRRRLGR